jgi:hypothetical protein
MVAKAAVCILHAADWLTWFKHRSGSRSVGTTIFCESERSQRNSPQQGNFRNHDAPVILIKMKN